MRNLEHLGILKQGIEEWNRWRKENPGIQPDMMGANLREAVLSRANFAGASISDANLSGANLSDADLRNAELTASNLSGADLRWADLSDADLLQADLSAADLSATKLCRAYIHDANLRNANLGGADLEGADLELADLEGANLEGANLEGANLAGAKLNGADLREASFRETRLSGADLNGADFSGAILHKTIFADCDLSGIRGLEKAQHVGPSSIGIDTVYKSGGKIPDAFLRAAGVPDSFLTFVHSLVVHPVQYYTCLIVFTEADTVFSQRLCRDLIDAGVRCWTRQIKDPEGVSMGRVSTSDYDKLLVICSEPSLSSALLNGDIVSALRKEDELRQERQIQQVLFPIQLDDYIFRAWQDHRRAKVARENTVDFRRWQDPVQYRKALDMLVRDLKA